MSCLVIGEIAQAHDGSLGTAHAFIDAIAAAGADAVKFQTHIADAESTPGEPWRIKFSPQDESRYDYWKRMEFTEAQWAGLKTHAEDKGLQFLSSPFSFEAVDLLERLGITAWKIASGEVNNHPMLRRMCETGKPILLSSGMSPFSELDQAVQIVQSYHVPLTVFQCTTAYPCPPEKVGLNMLPIFRERYNCAVGLSDHSGTIYPGLAAAAIGCGALEIHVTLSREMFGPDVSASVTTTELKQLVEGIRFIETMHAHPVDKDDMAQTMHPVRDLFTKSIYVAMNLKSGTVLEPRHLALKKPGTGIPAAQLSEIIGKRLINDCEMNTMLRREDLE